MIGRIGWNQQIEAQAHLQTFWSKLLGCASRLPNETVRTCAGYDVAPRQI
jgi:hypothetical protein